MTFTKRYVIFKGDFYKDENDSSSRISNFPCYFHILCYINSAEYENNMGNSCGWSKSWGMAVLSTMRPFAGHIGATGMMHEDRSGPEAMASGRPYLLLFVLPMIHTFRLLYPPLI